ncbi:RDD family protein [Candidatus Poriferisocius sp.]|uniref:RDD family protein n=1 Tax=Candidatus Poriferisocius sp. TaxID=3101276 RepID=UPI003B019037
MTDQQRPEVGDDSGPADLGRGRKTPAKQVTLGTGDTMTLADYGQRFRARIADSILIGIGFAVASFVKFWIDLPGAGGFGPPMPSPVTPRLVLSYVAFVPLFLYEIVAVAWRGKTLGMWSMGIRVVSIKTGHAPSMLASFWRGTLLAWLVLPVLSLLLYDLSPGSDATFLLLLSAIWVLLVHLSVFWGEDRRGWHDLITGTVVVTADPPRPADPLGGDTA